jgi:uncharacterized protein (DUF302 family)
MKPRTVVLFGNPKLGTAPMQKSGTLAIDNPPKALVWEDDNGKVWLTYNFRFVYWWAGLPKAWSVDASRWG